MQKATQLGGFLGALGATRTRDPLLRKQVLYPLSYEGEKQRNCFFRRLLRNLHEICGNTA